VVVDVVLHQTQFTQFYEKQETTGNSQHAYVVSSAQDDPETPVLRKRYKARKRIDVAEISANEIIGLYSDTTLLGLL